MCRLQIFSIKISLDENLVSSGIETYDLTLCRMTNFRFFQTEGVCRRLFQSSMKMAEISPNG